MYCSFWEKNCAISAIVTENWVKSEKIRRIFIVWVNVVCCVFLFRASLRLGCLISKKFDYLTPINATSEGETGAINLHRVRMW